MIDLRLWMYRALNPSIRSQVLDRDRRTCTNCGKKSKLQVHHIVPIRKGGSDDLDNLITLCSKCHAQVEPRRCMGYPVKVSEEYTTIKVSKSTYDILVALGKYGDTMDSIILRVLDGNIEKEAALIDQPPRCFKYYTHRRTERDSNREMRQRQT